MAWLVLALSLRAVLLLLTLLRRGTVARVSSLFYLVPPATAVAAYLLFGKRLTPLALAGLVVTAGGRPLWPRGPKALLAVAVHVHHPTADGCRNAVAGGN